MKHLLLSLFVLLVPGAKAQTFLPILTEGKVWHYCDSTIFGSKAFTMEVRGDTVVSGKNCKKLYYNDWHCTARLEEDGRLYCFEPKDEEPEEHEMPWPACDTLRLICDFNLEVGDEAWDEHVIRVDTIEVRGVRRKRIVVSDVFPQVIWVEGIGSYTNEWPSTEPKPTNGHIVTFIEECYENGELVFTKDDFFAPAVTTGIRSAEVTKKGSGKYYDLSGRPVNSPAAKGIYITDGKVIAR